MKKFIGRRAELGLPVEDAYVQRFVLFISGNGEAVATNDEWFIENVEEQNFFSMAIIIVEDVGWANWKSVFEASGKLTRNMLIPFDDNVLVFPWEVMVMNPDHRQEQQLPVLLPWNREEQPVYLSEQRGSENRELQLILRFIHRGEIGTIAPDICLEGLGEREIMNVVFKGNNAKNKVKYMDPTELDIVHFLRRHHITIDQDPDVVLPHVVLDVPWEECPGVTPVYEGLRVHLTYKDVERWLRNLQQRAEQVTLPKRIYQSTHGNPINFQDGQFKYLKPAVVVAPPPPRGYTSAAGGACATSSGGGFTKKEFVDIEDLMKGCPPCLRAVIEKKDPLKDGERFHLARQLFSAQVSKALCKEIYDKTTPDYNWEYVYNKEYKGAPCTEFIENARSRTENTIQCSYASKELNPQECCTKDFAKAYPTKVREGTVLKAPYQALLWYNYRK